MSNSEARRLGESGEQASRVLGNLSPSPLHRIRAQIGSPDIPSSNRCRPSHSRVRVRTRVRVKGGLRVKG